MKKLFTLLMAALLCIGASAQIAQDAYKKWHQNKYSMFIHFGLYSVYGGVYNGKPVTFGYSEQIQSFAGIFSDWYGDTALEFDPVKFNADEIVALAKEAGMRSIVITTKHHDGFCLWQTATTEYSVKNSPWKDGKGDVVRELRDACEKYGMKFGVYLSPWDRNAKSYGDSPAYNKLYIAQLTELLTQYGHIDEVWFDGACGEGENGRKQEYDWSAILRCVEEHQPHAVTAIMGDDVRWVGNEGGVGRETEWSVTAFTPESYERAACQNNNLRITGMSKDLGSRELLAKAQEVFWYPSEVDVSIRPGWFYHSYQDTQVRSLENLVDIYYKSVGRNSVLLLNIPPDTRGLIHEIDAARIKELKSYIDETFKTDFIAGRTMLWKADSQESKEFDVKSGSVFNTVMIREDIAKGQRVESFTLEGLYDGQWQKIA